MSNVNNTATVTAAANAAVNSGHALAQAVYASLSLVDQEKWSAFESAGAECALTVRWLPDRVEVRLGFTFGGAEPPVTILAIDHHRRADPLVKH